MLTLRFANLIPNVDVHIEVSRVEGLTKDGLQKKNIRLSLKPTTPTDATIHTDTIKPKQVFFVRFEDPNQEINILNANGFKVVCVPASESEALIRLEGFEQ